MFILQDALWGNIFLFCNEFHWFLKLCKGNNYLKLQLFKMQLSTFKWDLTIIQLFQKTPEKKMNIPLLLFSNFTTVHLYSFIDMHFSWNQQRRYIYSILHLRRICYLNWLSNCSQSHSWVVVELGLKSRLSDFWSWQWQEKKIRYLFCYILLMWTWY